MTKRRDWAKSGLHRPSSDEDKPARKRGRSERARFLQNDRRRVRRAHYERPAFPRGRD